MNKLGINYVSSWGLGCEESLKLYSEVGFDAIHTGWGDKEVTEKFAVNAQKNNLYYECIHAPFSNINSIWQEGEDGEIVLSKLINCVCDCKEFNVPMTVIHLSSGENAPCVNDIGRMRWDRLMECAVKNDIIIAFENQRKLANLAFVFELYRNVPQAKFCWDTGHEACFTPGLEFMPIFGDKLAYTHINDNMCEYNKDIHLIPFDGNIDFKRCAEFLKKYNYKGTLSLEIIPKNSDFYENISCEEYYKKAYQGIKNLRKLIKEA